MKYIGIIGNNRLATDYYDLLSTCVSLNIIRVKPSNAGATSFISEQGQRVEILNEISLEALHFIFICEDSKKLEKEIFAAASGTKVSVFNKQMLEMVYPFMTMCTQVMQNLELILNNMRDGLIVVNEQEQIQFMNETASDIVGVDRNKAHQGMIKDIITNSRLPKVLQNQKKEVNQKLQLENHKTIITTRIPLIDEQNHLIGAFAIFKDHDEVQRLAEETTDLTEIKETLKAIIHSSEEAISVVDEHGMGMMINPAYTRLTNLTEKEVIYQPATVDIAEGESIHLQVLRTRRPVRGVEMKVGPHGKAVHVNVAPIIVEGKLKGSIAVIHDRSEIQRVTTELKKAQQMIRDLEETYTFLDIVGDSPQMMIAVEQAKIGAKTSVPVLLHGEFGTGKEFFAHAIHNEGDRKYNKFIRVNCAVLSEHELETELFGYEDGACKSGESGSKKGLLEEANMGTVFLDEIGMLSLHMQGKILHVLQEKAVVRAGANIPIPLDVRIIVATNINLEQAVNNHTFNEDLYYHLNRLPIYIPTLQERIGDLSSLCHYMIVKMNQRYGRQITAISQDALEMIRQYHWPGNIQELENVIGRAVIFMKATENEIMASHISPLRHKKTEKQAVVNCEQGQTLQQATEHFEKSFIKQAYKGNKYNKTETAKQLHISVRNLYYKLEKYGLNK